MVGGKFSLSAWSCIQDSIVGKKDMVKMFTEDTFCAKRKRTDSVGPNSQLRGKELASGSLSLWVPHSCGVVAALLSHPGPDPAGLEGWREASHQHRQ